MSTPRRAIILAAGRGSRMAGLTEERPKCLLELGGRALLDWQLDALRQGGVEEVAIVTGYRPELLRDRGLVEFHNARWAETNMVASLACAASWMDEGTCLVCYADLYYESPAIAALLATDAALAITYDPEWEALWRRRFADPLTDAETFRINADGTLADIGGRPSTIAEIEGQYMGLLRFTPPAWQQARSVWNDLPPAVRDKTHMTGLLQRLLMTGRVPIRALPYHGRWGEFDSPEDLAALEL